MNSLLFLLIVQAPQITIAIQPLGSVSQTVIDTCVSGIKTLYDVEVVVLPQEPLPKKAYWGPGKRYRAEKVLDYLEEHVDPRYTKVLGLTTKDISTTKGEYYDWGIFGLGSMGGRTCVVSTFRLKRGKASDSLFYTRLIKVVNHELGHTFGLDHCTNDKCLMEDAKGKIKTVDEENPWFCPDCAIRIKEILRSSIP